MPRDIDERPGRRPALRVPFDLAAVVRCRDTLLLAVRYELVGKVLAGEPFERLVDLAVETLPPSVDAEAVRDSLRPLAGRTLTDADAQDYCHRLAGNARWLASRRSILPWSRRTFDEWVPFQILGARRQRTRYGRLGWSFACKAMAGTVCPMRSVRFWSDAQCAYLARQLGFRRPPPKKSKADVPYLYHTGRQLVGLRFSGLVEAELSEDGPAFREVRVPDSLKSWNEERFRLRDRATPEYDCPKGFDRSFPCHRCPFGYLTCPAGTHREDYAVKACPACKADDAFFDVELGVDRCLPCHERTVVKGEVAG